MPLTKINYTLNGGNREDVRYEIVNLFLMEKPGTGTDIDCSKYWYIVEAIGGYSIILKRPVPLNKGFDFTVNVDGMYFKKNRRYTNPSHSDICEILLEVRNDCEQYDKAIEFESIKKALWNIFNCQPFDVGSIRNIYFYDNDNNKRPLEIILLAIKWLFIEQDITYWNWSGRNMLWGKIIDI